MPQNGGIWLNMVERVWIGREYAWIYNNRQDSEYANVLNTFHAIHSLRSLYKLMSTYGDMGVFRRMSKIYDIGKKLLLTIFAKHSIRNLWETSEYMSGIKYARALKIPRSSICQGPEFLEFYSVSLFLQIWQSSEYASGCIYGRVLNISGFPICQVSANGRVTQGSEYDWITPEETVWLWQSSEYARSKFHKNLKIPPFLNMPGLRIW